MFTSLSFRFFAVSALSLLLLSVSTVRANSFDTTRVDSLLALAYSHHYNNPAKADSLYDIVLSECQRINYPVAEAYAHKGKGVVADEQGNAEQSIRHYKRSSELFLSLNDSLNAYKARFNEAMIYRKVKKYDLAKALFLECHDVFVRHGFAYGAVLCNSNYGIAEFDQEHYAEALRIFRQVEADEEALGTANWNTFGNIGNCYIFLDSTDKAIEYLQRAYDLARESGETSYQSQWGLSLATCYEEKGELEKAHPLFLESYRFARANGLKSDIMRSSRALATISENLGNFKDAYYYYKESETVEDSIDNAEFLIQLSEKEAVIKNEKTAKENAELRESENMARLQSKQDVMIRNIAIGGGIVLLLGLFVLVRLYQKKRTLNNLLTVKNEQIEEQHKEIQASINYAQHIQTALLTEDQEWKKISEHYFVFFRPKDVVSGDFFWAFHSDRHNISVWVAADCTGHGVPGAFMSMLGIGFLNEIVIENEILKPVEILNKLREKIIKALIQKNALKQRKDGIDLALCVWDKNTNILEFSGANNPLYIVRRQHDRNADSSLIKEFSDDLVLLELNADKMPVGTHAGELQSFSSSHIRLQPGDCLYTFSDGMPDQFGGQNGKKYKYKQFRQLLLGINNQPFEMHKSLIENSYDNWRQDFEQVDDICVIGIRV